ncbi:hypothetical protein NL676_008455 [Syzygium grande]|nr:hypothetical protein NL676_008455 [Syzygium grande]
MISLKSNFLLLQVAWTHADVKRLEYDPINLDVAQIEYRKVTQNMKEWAHEIPTADIAVVSEAHGFFRKIYLYEQNLLVGYVYCNKPNVTSYGPEHALPMSFHAALGHINRCEQRSSRGTTTMMFLRMFSTARIENSMWDMGGRAHGRSPSARVRSTWGLRVGLKERADGGDGEGQRDRRKGARGSRRWT